MRNRNRKFNSENQQLFITLVDVISLIWHFKIEVDEQIRNPWDYTLISMEILNFVYPEDYAWLHLLSFFSSYLK